MRRIIRLLLILIFLAACAAPAEEPAQTAETPPQEALAEDASKEEDPSEAGEAGDHVLLTLEAPLADGRTLTLEAVGKVEDEYTCRVREVRVYDGEELIQTVQAREGNMAFWGDGDLLPGESVSEYTSCWEPEGCMEAVDLNYDGNTDLGLFGFTDRSMPPYYYWIWDAEAERYQYAFTLIDVSVYPDTQELRSNFRLAADMQEMDYYKPDENGTLYLDRTEILSWRASGLEDRAARETWIPYPDQRFTPGDSNWSYDSLLLVRRVLPVREFHEDGTSSNFTEIWELIDGELQMTSREEFSYEALQ